MLEKVTSSRPSTSVFIRCILIAFVIRFIDVIHIAWRRSQEGSSSSSPVADRGKLSHSASLIRAAYLTSTSLKKVIRGVAYNSLRPIDRFEQHLRNFKVLKFDAFLCR